MTKFYNNIILGAGINGCSIAYELAKTKNSTLVIDKNTGVGQGTTSAAGGIFMYNKSIKRPEAWHKIASQTVEQHHRLEKELNGLINWNWSGRAEVAFRNSDIKVIKAKYELEKSEGKNVAWLFENDVEKKFSLSKIIINKTHKGFQGYINKEEGWVHPIKLCYALYKYSQNNGVDFLFDFSVKRIFFKNGKAHIVLHNSEIISAENVVIALGPDVASIKIEGVIAPEVTPVKGESLLLKGIKTQFNEVLYANGIWAVPRHEGLFLGATLDEGNHTRGNTIKAANLMYKLTELFPNLSNHPLSDVEYYYGFRPKLKDEVPIIRRDKENPNLIWAIGQQNNGVLMAPLTGIKVAQELS